MYDYTTCQDINQVNKAFIYIEKNIGMCDNVQKDKEIFNMTEITKDMKIGDILDNAKETAPLFLEMGMHCLGCPSARNETVAQACMVHGVNPDEFIAKLNAFLTK